MPPIPKKGKVNDETSSRGSTQQTQPMSLLNREGWLTEAASLLAPLFPDELRNKPFRVTCGWPSIQGLGAKFRRVGECHAIENSKAGVHELFISPVLDDPLDVAGTLAHELAHVAAGLKAAHGKEFVKICHYVGLTSGKPKSIMPGPLLNAKIKDLLKTLPEYPHKALVPTAKEKGKSAGSVGLICTDVGCGCRVSIARKWLDAIPSLPTCGCGFPFSRKDGNNDGAGDE